MKLKNVLIVVKNIERARQFYHDLFGLEMILDYEACFITAVPIRKDRGDDQTDGR